VQGPALLGAESVLHNHRIASNCCSSVQPWTQVSLGRFCVAARLLILDRLQLELSAVTDIDKLHINVLPGHDRCFVIQSARYVLGRTEFFDLTIMPELVRLGYANRVRFD
jgi:hypothetical protein